MHASKCTRTLTVETFWRVVCSDKAISKDLEFMLDGRAHGRFFVPDERTSDADLAKSDNHLYFGELPLSFAVSTGQPEMFDLLLEYAALLPDGCFNRQRPAPPRSLHLFLWRWCGQMSICPHERQRNLPHSSMHLLLMLWCRHMLPTPFLALAPVLS